LDPTEPPPPIEMVRVIAPTAPALGRWAPIVGEATLDLQGRATDLTPDEKRTVLGEANAILSRCPNPGLSVGRVTGLVVGRIQSGKTMSFTTLAALASDNGYRMIIVITGISSPLLEQSVSRLRKDLGVEDRPWRWQHFTNPREDNGPIIASALEQWTDAALPRDEMRTVLITVMKNTRHLRALASLLRNLRLDGVPVLVIDDEADQASLNIAVNRGSTSATYRRIREIRDLLPLHAYVEYTATPQAPLLINIIDTLSPEFAELITPGDDYTGGHSFFEPGEAGLIRAIPAGDRPSDDAPLAGPPNSLLEALRIFFLGVAAEATKPVANRNIRSMIVHPTRLVAGHSDYYNWIIGIQTVWAGTLRKEPTDPDRIGFIDDFRPAFEDLSRTVENLPSFDTLVPLLLRVISSTVVTEMNTARGPTPTVEWERGLSHILVGGQAMDRGFTARGLTVTYMPRGPGVGQADTIQQRARFFGYKRKYLGYCRVYLDSEVEDAFRKYVEHEDDVHTRLQAHQLTERPLSDWKRAFFLDRSLKPTRDSVIDIAYRRSLPGDEWEWPHAPQEPEDAAEANSELVEEFLAHLAFTTADSSGGVPEFQHHRVARKVSLREVYEGLLVPYRLGDPDDSQRWVGVLLQIERYLADHPETTCTVIDMSEGKNRQRTLDQQGRIPTLFQGPTEGVGGSHYPGDAKILSDDGSLTVQVHHLNLTSHAMPEPEALAPKENVVALAVWIPASMAVSMIIQPQGLP
jgi:Z1 domain